MISSAVFKSGIDVRLSPVAGSPKISLYPALPFNSRIDLPLESIAANVRERIAKYFAVSRSQVFFGRSASACMVYLLCALSQIHSRRMRIALPAFNCHEFAFALSTKSLEMILLDLDSSFALTEQSIRYAAQKNVDLLIWPSYFSYRERKPENIKLVNNFGLQTVLDEAQSFPAAGHYSLHKKYARASLISFGKSKRFAGRGGGAIILYDQKVATKMQEMLKRHWCGRDYRETIVNSVGVLYETPVFERLDQLLERCAVEDRDYAPIERCHLEHVYSYFLHEELIEARLRVNYECLYSYLKTLFRRGVNLVFEPQVPVPSIFAVRVNGKSRFKLMHALRMRGIQSTWYYLPLHLQARYQGFMREDLVSTEMNSAEILILPCQARHSVDDMIMLGETICSILN